MGLDKSQYAGYWVEHTDKLDEVTHTPRLELNFVFANVELTTGKALPVYFHPIDEARVDCWKELKNLEMGLTDPNAFERKRLIRITNNLPKNVKETLALIDEEMRALVASGKVNNRYDVVRVLSEHFEITAIKNKSISIANPHGGTRPIRLKGAMYEESFDSRYALIEPPVIAPKKDVRHRNLASTERLEKLKSDYQRLWLKRTQSLAERFEPRRKTKKKFNKKLKARKTPTDFIPQADTYYSVPYQLGFDFQRIYSRQSEHELETLSSSELLSESLMDKLDSQDNIEEKNKDSTTLDGIENVTLVPHRVRVSDEANKPSLTTKKIDSSKQKPMVEQKNLEPQDWIALKMQQEDERLVQQLFKEFTTYGTPRTSQSTVRKGIGSLISTFIESTKKRFRELGSVIQERQSRIEQIGELAHLGYGKIKQAIEQRAERQRQSEQAFEQQRSEWQSYYENANFFV